MRRGTNYEPLEQVQYNDEYNVFSSVNQHYEQSESTSNTCLVETDDSDVTPNSPDMCEHDIQTDQNAKDERDALANLIANLKLDVDENKKIQKKLKKANTSIAHELEQCKSILVETSKTLEESNSVQDSFLFVLQTKQTEFEKYKACHDRTVDYDKLKCKLNETLGLLAQKDIDIKEGLKLKAYEIPIVKEKHDELIKQSLLTKSHYEDLVQGNITINRVYYAEGLNHNLFLVGQLCDVDLEVAFPKSTCFVRDLQGNDLLTDNCGSDLYIISLQESNTSTPIFLMAKASPTKAWLWHQRLSHLNFDYINLLSKKNVVIGLPKLKYIKDQLCSSCEVSKVERSLFRTKTVLSSKGRLNLLHMDLCGPMRVASINGKKYILVIIYDYSRYTWTLFLCSKDETPEVLKDFLMMIQRNLQALVISVRTDRGIEFLNKAVHPFFKEEKLSIKLIPIEHLNRTTLWRDETALWLRLLE
nr:retrovirus-related Pol polyprotein from transposon TNT 1-94 [Tanacetum cinerariifolium]